MVDRKKRGMTWVEKSGLPHNVEREEVEEDGDAPLLQGVFQFRQGSAFGVRPPRGNRYRK